jgi:hypothetical protein
MGASDGSTVMLILRSLGGHWYYLLISNRTIAWHRHLLLLLRLNLAKTRLGHSFFVDKMNEPCAAMHFWLLGSSVCMLRRYILSR